MSPAPTISTLGFEDPVFARLPFSPFPEGVALCGLEKCLIMASVTINVKADDVFDRHILGDAVGAIVVAGGFIQESRAAGMSLAQRRCQYNIPSSQTTTTVYYYCLSVVLGVSYTARQSE